MAQSVVCCRSWEGAVGGVQVSWERRGGGGGDDSWCLLWGLCVLSGCSEEQQGGSSRAAGDGGAGVKPVERLVELVCSLFVSLSCSSIFPLEAGNLSHPTPPCVIVLQFSP